MSADLHADVLARLAAAEAVEAAGTPGPTSVATTAASGGDHWYIVGQGKMLAFIHANDGSDEEQREPDAKMLSAARNAYPAALVWVREAVTYRHGPGPLWEHGFCGTCSHRGDVKWPCRDYRQAAAVLGVHIPPHDKEQAGE